MDYLSRVIAFHSTARIAEGLCQRYVEFKRLQGEVQLRTPGFLKRLLLEDLHDPGMYYYISIYRDADANRRLREDPEFQALTSAFDVTVMPLEQRAAMQARGQEPPWGLTQQLELARCSVVIDESIDGRAAVAMHAEVPTASDLESLLRTPAGLCGRLLLRDEAAADRYFHISLWQRPEDARNVFGADAKLCAVLQDQSRVESVLA